jgi:hypothetical protein
MHERLNGLRSCGTYFFRGDFEHIIEGVVLEYVPKGLYIWDFRFPLFDFFGSHLTFSRRLQDHAFIAKGEKSEEAIVDLVMTSPEVRCTFDADTPMRLSEFYDQYLLEIDPLRNPHLLLVKSAALVLLGQEARAADVLSELPPTLHSKHIPHWNQLKASLQQGQEAARMLLDQVRLENLRTLDLT